ncbi:MULTISPECIES: DUF2884 family protein [Dyella]|uniref:DUF2884 family protein n=2 Tax=Dyella TaxID=231454 RepID=A0A4V2NLA4_9GAMM|nr:MULTISPECIES: DUF2884 family protein [Dyella]TBR36795.1 DUF2884 family protein [Dyella terrae]TCI08114.1 DUF2884 family protein [Dyella soli]
MRIPAFLALSLFVTGSLHAQDLATTCQASSSYDLTLKPDALVFDRPQPAPFHVELHDGNLRTDGNTVRLNAEDQDRMALFERELRALAPRARTVAQNGIDLLAQAVRAEALNLGLSAQTRADVDQRVAARVVELKQRIANSQSTRDWQGDMADQYANQIASDLLPLIVGDLGQQAMQAAMTGDLQAAADLRDKAAGLATELRPRLERRMQALKPQIQALCPSIQRLAELQQGVRGGNGQPLNLVQIAQ